ncbi:MAG: hypothetical protein ACHQFX_01260 [Chitinophagales bacterium]
MKFPLLATLLLTTTVINAQKFELQYGTENDRKTESDLANNQKISVSERPQFLQLKVDAPGVTYVLFLGDAPVGIEFPGDNKPHVFNTSSLEFNDKGEVVLQITNKTDQRLVRSFLFFNANTNGNGRIIPARDTTSRKYISLQRFLETLDFKFESKRYGLIVISGNTLYKGDQYVHIFLDQYGNSIYGTLPQGIADRQYVVHVLYLSGITSNQVIFDVKKTKGSFNPALNFLNSDISETIARSAKDVKYSWIHAEYLLGISTTDVEFDLTKTTVISQDDPYDYKNEKVGTYNIKMTPTYHGSFNVGFVNSHLENPTFELVENPANSSQKVVKQTGTGNRGVVTVMATIYTSPVILIEKLFNKEIPWNKTYGRNFLDDHRFFERIYPAIGVGFVDNTLENIFYGANWELFRGAGFFFGAHWGKVSTFRTDGNFEFENTPITQAEFDLRKNEKWKTKFAIGFNIDPFIVSKLLSGGLK